MREVSEVTAHYNIVFFFNLPRVLTNSEKYNFILVKIPLHTTVSVGACEML